MHAGPHVFSKGLGQEAPLVVSLLPCDPGSTLEEVIVVERYSLGWKFDYATQTPLGFDPDTLITCYLDKAGLATDPTRFCHSIIR